MNRNASTILAAFILTAIGVYRAFHSKDMATLLALSAVLLFLVSIIVLSILGRNRSVNFNGDESINSVLCASIMAAVCYSVLGVFWLISYKGINPYISWLPTRLLFYLLSLLFIVAGVYFTWRVIKVAFLR